MIKKYQQNSRDNLEVPRAFVLMNVNAGSEEQVIVDAKTIGFVKEAYLCFGAYDLILKIETNSIDEMKKLVAYKYRSIENVKSVLTLLLTEEYLALKPFLNSILIVESKKKEERKECLSEEKIIQNFASSILVNN